jgi:hypothetical protein
MMARKKHPGGRKPQGEYSELAVHMSMRMPKRMHKRLTAEARARKRSATQELLRRLDNSFKEDERKERDPAMQALCFLIAETAHQVVGPHSFIMGTNTETPLSEGDWRSTPFFFRAFKLAVAQILDALQPPGDVKAPRVNASLFPVETATQEGEESYAAWLKRSFESPEARADYTSRQVLGSLMEVSKQSIEALDERARLLEHRFPASHLREHYGMVNAVKDLQIPKSK